MELLVENWAEREMTAYELERGKPMPSFNHSYIQNELIIEINLKYRKTYTTMPELTLAMPEKPNCVPDITIYHKMNANFLHDKITYSEMPITTIEIVTPTQSIDEILLKFERYFFAGVQSCWLVQPSLKVINVYSNIGKYEYFNENMNLIDNVTGIELNLSEIFK
jgi:Uma2 family endonuclease